MRLNIQISFEVADREEGFRRLFEIKNKLQGENVIINGTLLENIKVVE